MCTRLRDAYLAASIAIAGPACIFGEDTVPELSNLECMPADLMLSTPPYSIHCGFDVANDGGQANVTTIGADGLQIAVQDATPTVKTGHVAVDFKLPINPPVGALTVVVSVIGDTDGLTSNEVTGLIIVQ
jgi:hypothetical protein